MTVSTFNGDCLEIMPSLQEHSVDMILCDLPYGTTRNEWDSMIPLDRLWEQYRRLLKGGGCAPSSRSALSPMFWGRLT